MRYCWNDYFTSIIVGSATVNRICFHTRCVTFKILVLTYTPSKSNVLTIHTFMPFLIHFNCSKYDKTSVKNIKHTLKYETFLLLDIWLTNVHAATLQISWITLNYYSLGLKKAIQQKCICPTNCIVPTFENCKNVSWIYFSFSDRKWGVYNYKERITVLHFLSFNLFSLIIQFHKFVCLQGIFALLAQSMLLCLHEFWNLDTTNIKTYCVFDTFSLIRVC